MYIHQNFFTCKFKWRVSSLFPFQHYVRYIKSHTLIDGTWSMRQFWILKLYKKIENFSLEFGIVSNFTKGSGGGFQIDSFSCLWLADIPRASIWLADSAIRSASIWKPFLAFWTILNTLGTHRLYLGHQSSAIFTSPCQSWSDLINTVINFSCKRL